MGVFYKYMSYRDGFFIKPRLRLTQRKALNDPFELLPQASQVASLYRRVAQVAKANGQSFEGLSKVSEIVPDSEEALYNYTSLMDNFGIVSLAKSCENILMWSHYADEHRGVCIGIDSEWLGSNNNAIHSSRVDSEVREKVQPVIYSKDRAVNEGSQLHFNHLFDSFFVKSEGWSYEQELRVVTELVRANEVIVSRSGVNKIREDGYSENVSINPIGGGGFKVVFEGVEMKKGDNNFYAKEDVKCRSMKSGLCATLAREPCSVFLLDVPFYAIKEIIFGCQTPQSVIDEVVEDVFSWKDDVKFFRSVKDVESFDIRMVPVVG